MRNVLPDVSDLIINNGNISSQQKITYTPPTFASATEEREWLKFRLAQAFRIFGNGLNEWDSLYINTCYSSARL